MMNAHPELVQGLAPDVAEQILSLGARLSLTHGEALFGLGDAADRLYVVQRGRIALRLPMQLAGRAQDVVVEERGAGQTVGWSALIPPHRFTLEARALVDTDVLALSRDRLEAYFKEHPAVAWAVTQNLAAVVGQRLQVIQAMWLREMQRVIDFRYA